MKISAINNVYQNKSFKGLWGESKTESNYDSMYTYDKTTLTYYPFKDETQEEIDKVVKEKEYHTEDPWYQKPKSVSEPYTNFVDQVVMVMAALPFTAKDFRDYLSNAVSDLKRAVIERHILEKNLRHMK